MTDRAITIPRLDDSTVLKILRALIDTYKPQGVSVNLFGVAEQLNLKSHPDSPVAKAIDRTNSFAIATASIFWAGFSVVYERPANVRIYDEVTFKSVGAPNQQPLSDAERIKIIQLFNEYGAEQGITTPSQPADEDLSSLYQSTIFKLETAFARQIETITNWTVEKTAELENHRRRLNDDVDAERKKLVADYEAKRQDLIARKVN